MIKILSFIVLSSTIALTNSAFADLAKGKESFAQRCASCHGVSGAGDGPVAAAMAPGSITNLTKGQFKFATDTNKLKELLQKGGAAVGLNPMMTGAVGASESEIADLAEYVQSLHQK